MTDHLSTSERWENLLTFLHERFGKRPDLNGVLFLIGVQELGQGPQRFSKEQKQDLMHVAVCKLLSASGYYMLEGHDADGWPHWEANNTLPALTLAEQESLLKQHACEYFQSYTAV
ncbi:MAG: hypothetical protein WBA12_01015 [Catalinimonas sp.]